MEIQLLKYSMLVIAIAFAVSFSGCSARVSELRKQTTVNPKVNTDFARKLTIQAITQFDQSNWIDARLTLCRAIAADETFGPAHNNLGIIYFHEGNLYQAAWEFQHAAELMPYQPEPLNNLGLALEAAGKLNDAIDHYDQALKIEPNNPQFAGNAARARIRRGDNDLTVRELLNKLVAMDTRPQWVQWAREKLVMIGPKPTTEPESQP